MQILGLLGNLVTSLPTSDLCIFSLLHLTCVAGCICLFDGQGPSAEHLGRGATAA